MDEMKERLIAGLSGLMMYSALVLHGANPVVAALGVLGFVLWTWVLASVTNA